MVSGFQMDDDRRQLSKAPGPPRADSMLGHSRAFPRLVSVLPVPAVRCRPAGDPNELQVPARSTETGSPTRSRGRTHLESYPPGINVYIHVCTMYVTPIDNAIVRTRYRHVCTFREKYKHVCTCLYSSEKVHTRLYTVRTWYVQSKV